MATAIKIPDLGTNVEQVRLVAWLKKEGDHINRGEALCEVETDKAVSELESIAEGILLKLVVPEDTELEQGIIIAYIGAPGETLPVADQPVPAVSLTPPQASAVPASSLAGNAPPAIIIRNLAKKLGVDLARVTGTGPGGRILQEDVLKAKQAIASAGEVVQPPAQSAGTSLSSHQTVIARRVMQSHREIPPINLTCQIDMSAVIAYRRRTEKESMRKLGFDAFFVFAAAKTIAEYPHFRSRLRDGMVILSDAIDVGVAVSIGDDLFTPAIRRADTKSIPEIDMEMQKVIERVKKRLIQPSDMALAVMTISNLGMYPVRSFAAVIPPDQSSALAIGCTEETHVVLNGSVKIVFMAMITLSVDHRLINGREAGQFLAQLKERVEKI